MDGIPERYFSRKLIMKKNRQTTKKHEACFKGAKGVHWMTNRWILTRSSIFMQGRPIFEIKDELKFIFTPYFLK